MELPRRLRVAVCISGQLRKLQKTVVPKVFSTIVPDYYIHTWDNEHNPNLPDVHKYYPDAQVETEKYEDVFDNILPIDERDGVIPNRYSYAQFYSVAKSFQMCANSKKQYDLIFRVRTDLDIPVLQFKDHDNFAQEIEKLTSALWNHYVHMYHLPAAHLPPNVTFLPEDRHHHNFMKAPFVSVNIKSASIDNIVIDDWFWAMNNSALAKLTETSPIDLVKTAYTIKAEHRKNIPLEYAEYEALKSPCAWSKIFHNNHIMMLSCKTLGTGAGLIRNPPDQQNIVSGHGDIS
jgi:hypothetical protein